MGSGGTILRDHPIWLLRSEELAEAGVRPNRYFVVSFESRYNEIVPYKPSSPSNVPERGEKRECGNNSVGDNTHKTGREE